MPVAQAARPRLLPLRAVEPPFDDGGDWGKPRSAPAQPRLPLAFAPRTVRPVTFYSPQRHLTGPATVEGDLGSAPAWRATPRSELCDPVPWARQLARGVAEVLVDARAPRQLAAWLTEDAHTELRRAAWRYRVHARRRNGRPTGAGTRARERSVRILVRSVHVTEPRDGVAEISAHLCIDGRGVAVALRAEGRDGRWVCTAIDLG